MVSRTRLLERMDTAMGVKLVLVSAPAGFGKTTLVSDWLSRGKRSAAWLSLSKEDSELKRFLSYVVAALQRLDESLGLSLLSVLESSQLPSIEVLLTSLLNDLAEYSAPAVLVLDDYHELDSRDVDDGLAFLLEHLPSNMRVVITTREDPPLALPRLRARAELLEFRANDLRFTVDEATEFLNKVMGLSLSNDVISTLEARTEGWIAGLQMAALSIQGRDADAFVDAFAGSHRFVLDYLAEEVLAGQPKEIRSFLLQTSILERLSADLCAAVTGHTDAQGMLELLERSNLFLLPLDDARQWYRYHHLFAEVLQARLGDGEQLSDLHVKASLWFEEQGLSEGAIHHALTAKDFDRAAGIIELIGPDLRMYKQDATLFKWLEAFPKGFAESRPILSLDYANAAFARGQLELAELYLQTTERLLKTDDRIVVNEEEFQNLPIRIAMTKVTYAQAQGDAKAATNYAKAAFELATEKDFMWRAGAAGLLGLAFWAEGKVEAAYTTFSEAMTTLQQAGYPFHVLGGSMQLADIKLAQGRLSEALKLHEQALESANTQGDVMRQVIADLHVGLSELYFEKNQLDYALEHLAKREGLGEHSGFPEHRYRSFIANAHIDAAQGDFESALELLGEAENYYIRGIFPEVRPITALKVRLWLKQGYLDKALAWVDEQGLSLTDDLSYLAEFEHLTLAKVLLAQFQKEKPPKSLEQISVFLQRLLDAAEQSKRGASILNILIVQALTYKARGNHEQALECLERALNLAEPEGYVRSFVDEGVDMLELLSEANRKKIMPAYVSTLLAAFGTEDNGRAASTQPEDIKSSGKQASLELTEPLTKRELEILKLLAQGHSNKEISQELYRALDTIKGHNRNIFSKLQVQNRTQAVAKARKLGLI